jgi:hypothetical protein
MELLNQIARGRTWRRFFGALFLMVGILAVNAQESASEYQVKAAFLVNFPKYTDWPTEAFVETNSPIIIAILGETKVAEELQKIISGRTINGRKILLKRLVIGEEASAFHILFIAATEQPRAPNLLAKLKRGVLTVGESEEFLSTGGMINLARRSQKVALDVNLAATEAAGLQISSKLLSVANVVKGKLK